MILAWIGVLYAADPSQYPLVAPIELPAAGPVAVPLVGDAVGAEPELAAAGLLVLDGAGNEVPYAVVPMPDAPPDHVLLGRRPLDAVTWEIEAADRPLDALELRLDDLDSAGPQRVTVSAWERGAWVPVGERLLFDLRGDPPWEQTTVPVGGRTGPFRLSIVPSRSRADLLRVDGIVTPDDVVQPLVESFDAGAPAFTDEGRVRYVFPLPGPRAITDVKLRVDGDVFERRVTLGVPTEYGDPNVVASGVVQRVELAGTRVDRVDLHDLDVRTDVLVVDVDTDRGRPLAVQGIDVTSRALAMVLRDAGAGPHRLFLAGREEAHPYDLGVGAYELIRLRPPVVRPGAVAPNAEFVPLPTREGVDAAGTVVNRARYRWERAIEGAGWLRVSLDRHVLGHARADLGDVRVVDASGAQLPYLVRPGRRTVAWDVPPFTRDRDARTGDTLIRVPLGADDVPVEWITITTSVDTFERDVLLVRDRGRTTETVRHVTWSGAQQGRTLTLSVGERLGGEVLLRIVNGDNPPIPVESVGVGGPVRDLVVHAPDGGARLLYGAPGEDAPRYDLSLLAADVHRIPFVDAALGEEVAIGGPALSGFDRVVVLGAVGALAFGLLLLTVRVLRAVPEAEAAGEGGGEPPSAPPGPPPASEPS